MRMLVVGTGSTGGYFGGGAARAGREVPILVRPVRAAQLAEHELQIVCPHCDFTLRPQLIAPDRISGSYDAIVLREFPLWLATAHNAGAALLLMAPVGLSRALRPPT
jgi:hypothetical protein